MWFYKHTYLLYLLQTKKAKKKQNKTKRLRKTPLYVIKDKCTEL